MAGKKASNERKYGKTASGPKRGVASANASTRRSSAGNKVNNKSSSYYDPGPAISQMSGFGGDRGGKSMRSVMNPEGDKKAKAAKRRSVMDKQGSKKSKKDKFDFGSNIARGFGGENAYQREKKRLGLID